MSSVAVVPESPAMAPNGEARSTALTAPVQSAGLRPLRPIAAPAQLIEQQNAARAFVLEVLEKGRDYGVIPGTDKPTLLKPGAEKVTLGFGLSVQSTIVEREVDHERVVTWVKRKAQWEGPKGRRRKVGEEVIEGTSIGLYRYVVRVELVDADGVLRGSGLGVCSTMESKYIDRPRDSENTALKMAFKRAHVAAVLTTTGLSDSYTQDVEDMPHMTERADQPPEAMLMPFGKTKGTPLAELESAELESAAAWAADKGKFEDFQEAVTAILKARGETAAPAATPAAPAQATATPSSAATTTAAPKASIAVKPEEFVMPFGRTKGTPIGKLDVGDLKSAMEWALDKGKFADFVTAARAVLAKSELARHGEPLGLDDGGVNDGEYHNPDDDLPF